MSNHTTSTGGAATNPVLHSAVAEPDPIPRTIHFVSLGCAKNRVDTEVMLGVSGVEGFTHVEDPADAEVIVVNTCGFIGPAKEESVDTILEMAGHKEGRCQRLVVSGCLSQRYVDQLMVEMPEVDHFLGSSDMLKLGPLLKLGTERGERMLVGNPADYTMRATDPRRLTQWGHSAYMKIAEGCNRSCSFCAIPSFRGKQRSRPISDLVDEAVRLSEMGVREINLISQDTIAYGRDLPADASGEKQTLAALAVAPAEAGARPEVGEPEGRGQLLQVRRHAHPALHDPLAQMQLGQRAAAVQSVVGRRCVHRSSSVVVVVASAGSSRWRCTRSGVSSASMGARWLS